MLAKLLYALPALAVGAGVAVQGIVNAGLARGIGSYVVAAAISFWVGTLSLTALSLATGGVGQALTAGRGLAIGWWIAGGLLGATFVTMMAFIVPRIGIGAATAFVVAGQLIAAALLDHFGALGVYEQPLTALRMLGIGLLIAGALLVRFF
jgi:bacterial/archaeal transporter family-2 protein